MLIINISRVLFICKIHYKIYKPIDDLNNKIQKNIFAGNVDLAKDQMHEITLSGQVISYNIVSHVSPETYVSILRSYSDSVSCIRITNVNISIIYKQNWSVVYFTLH